MCVYGNRNITLIAFSLTGPERLLKAAVEESVLARVAVHVHAGVEGGAEGVTILAGDLLSSFRRTEAVGGSTAVPCSAPWRGVETESLAVQRLSGGGGPGGVGGGGGGGWCGSGHHVTAVEGLSVTFHPVEVQTDAQLGTEELSSVTS